MFSAGVAKTWFPPGVPNILSALNLMPAMTGIQHFRCFFQDPDTKSLRNSLQHTYHLPGAITRVAQFISRLERIEKAEIFLIWDQYFVKREKNITDISFGDLKEWSKAFARMLNLIVERGCNSLTIQYDPAVLPAFRFRPAGPVQKAISYCIHEIKNLLSYVGSSKTCKAATNPRTWR